MNKRHAWVKENTPIREVISVMDEAPHHGGEPGIAVVLDATQHILGVVTDGDMRRVISENLTLSDPVETIMSKDPITVSSSLDRQTMLKESLNKMRKKNVRIEQILLTNDQGQFSDIVNMHDLYKENDVVHRPVAIYGLGFVGMTLAVALAECEVFQIIGVDTNEGVIKKLCRGRTSFYEKGLDSALKQLLSKESISFANDHKEVSADIHIISVGTPIGDDGKPSLDHLEQCSRNIASILKRGDLVICRSTVPVGTTREFLIPLMEKVSALKAGVDFHIAFAPERTVEGAALKELRSLPQIIGGLTDRCADLAATLFRKLTTTIVRVPSLESAEIVKLINNTFRDLSFSFANEVAYLCDGYNINAFELIEAANEGYPRNPISKPSPGVGGPCLTKDSHLYSCTSLDNQFSKPILGSTSRTINSRGAEYVLWQYEKFLKEKEMAPKGEKVLVVGLAFKGWPETSDMRDSPSVDLIKKLQALGCDVFGYDAVISAEEIKHLEINPTDKVTEGLREASAVFFMNNHLLNSKIDLYQSLPLMKKPSFFFDGWNLFGKNEVEGFPNMSYASMGYITRPLA
jgi:UDP-N-acetyl-D-mannosaminuronic acid dehydrogenase